MKVALVTITDTKYIKGTQNLLYSFLKHNAWFEGDFIIMESDLSNKDKLSLSKFPNLRFEQPSPTLLERIKILSFFWSPAKEKSKTFYSLEAFRFPQYDKVLFVDSDILFLQNIYSLFYSSSNLKIAAVADNLLLNNEIRNKENFLPTPIDETQDGIEYYQSFNSGLIIINNTNQSPSLQDIYLGLIKAINPSFFSKNHTYHTDQYILNQTFNKNVKLLPSDYNYLLNTAFLSQYEQYDTIPNNIKVIHYLESNKPWKKQLKNNIFIEIWQQYFQEFKQSKFSNNEHVR